MRTEDSASSLTVWVGSMRYAFSPGRDVLVGYGPGCDIPLERVAAGTPPPAAPRPDVVLRFTGTHWVAIDLSHNGIFVKGARVPTVDIRDGQGISLADPQHGPRLVFQIPASAGPPGPPSGPARGPAHPPPQFPPPPAAAQPGRPNDPNLRSPTQRATQQMRITPTRPPAPERPAQPPRVGPAPPVPPAPPPAAVDEQPKARGLIERMVTGKLRAARPSFRTEEANSTHRLPLKQGARTTGVIAHGLGLVVDGREILADISLTARPGALVAVIGPSAARNSALLGLLAGTGAPSSGRATVDGHDVHAEPESMRSRIGIVPRDDRLHRHLTVERAMEYAAELRLPPDTSPEHRHRGGGPGSRRARPGAPPDHPDQQTPTRGAPVCRDRDRAPHPTDPARGRRPGRRAGCGATESRDRNPAAPGRHWLRRGGGYVVAGVADQPEHVRSGVAAHPRRHHGFPRHAPAGRVLAGHRRLVQRCSLR